MDKKAYVYTEDDIKWMMGLLERAQVPNVSRTLAITMLQTVKPLAHEIKPEDLLRIYKEQNEKELGRQ